MYNLLIEYHPNYSIKLERKRDLVTIEGIKQIQDLLAYYLINNAGIESIQVRHDGRRKKLTLHGNYIENIELRKKSFVHFLPVF